MKNKYIYHYLEDAKIANLTDIFRISINKFSR